MGEQAGECLYKCVIEHHFEGGNCLAKGVATGWQQGGHRLATGAGHEGRSSQPKIHRFSQEQAALVVLSLWHLLTQIVAITHKVACQSI